MIFMGCMKSMLRLKMFSSQAGTVLLYRNTFSSQKLRFRSHVISLQQTHCQTRRDIHAHARLFLVVVYQGCQCVGVCVSGCERVGGCVCVCAICSTCEWVWCRVITSKPQETHARVWMDGQCAILSPAKSSTGLDMCAIELHVRNKISWSLKDVAGYNVESPMIRWEHIRV